MIGSGGAGKTTLVTAIADRLGLSVVHLDQEFWRPVWEPTDVPRWRTRVTELVAADRWVLDGNSGGSLDLRLPRTELIVFLDLRRRVTIPRVLRRWARWRGRIRPDIPRLPRASHRRLRGLVVALSSRGQAPFAHRAGGHRSRRANRAAPGRSVGG